MCQTFIETTRHFLIAGTVGSDDDILLSQHGKCLHTIIHGLSKYASGNNSESININNIIFFSNKSVIERA